MRMIQPLVLLPTSMTVPGLLAQPQGAGASTMEPKHSPRGHRKTLHTDTTSSTGILMNSDTAYQKRAAHIMARKARRTSSQQHGRQRAARDTTLRPGPQRCGPRLRVPVKTADTLRALQIRSGRSDATVHTTLHRPQISSRRIAATCCNTVPTRTLRTTSCESKKDNE